ncbi:MAG TPA: Ppx/GppA phosphatase family protein [Thermoanaerobaculia bacterium]|jgi:exopolyphosphatase/guanosine-5'-triphosphate,3'-diphosphate pyrophosphatase|nr:Ppx/GppA phosphatase family protein [Thermoanaerobaculia bacterium]
MTTAPDPRPYRIAAIDVGTNSIHMIIAEAERNGYRVIDKEKEMVQLGRGSLEGRPLTDDAIERGVSTLRTMAEIARRREVNDIVAVATSAIREAPNRRRFLSEVRKHAGIKLRVISGEEEADYIYRAVRSAVDFHGGTALSIDVGGGSVEMIVGTSSEVFFTRSEPAGALRIAQAYGLESSVSDEALKKCRRAARKMLKKTLARIAALGFDFTIGTSGTIATLAAMAAESQSVTSGLRWLSVARLRELITLLAPLTAAERARKFGMDEKRAETIVAGAVVLEQIMRGLEIERLRACDVALREGIVETMLDRLRQQSAQTGGVRTTSVRELAERTHVDMDHAAHVARLALRMFDQLEDLHMLKTGERELLESAALLHEAGMHVSFQGHHKHSYYLISHAGLRGFTGDQVAVIANVARYYRKALPAVDHDNFAQLSPAQRETVCKLAAILRVADALDRRRHGAVRDVAVDAGENVVSFRLRLRADGRVEIDAAQKRAKYFAKVFGRAVELRWRRGNDGDEERRRRRRRAARPLRSAAPARDRRREERRKS